MNRTLLSNAATHHIAPPSVRERILSSFNCSTSTSGRACCSQQHQLVVSAPRQSTCCSATKTAKGGKSSGGQGFKGFGDAPKAPAKQPQRDLSFDRDSDEEQQLGPAAAAAAQLGDDDDEQGIKLMPAYQMYVDAGYKAQRYVGPLALQRSEGEPLAMLATSQAMLPGDLLLVCPALSFVEGGFNEVPELEDLHAALLEDGPSPMQRRVMDILESLRPAPSTSTSPASTSPAASSAPSPSVPLPSLSTLDPKFWSGRGKDTSAPAFSSKRVMELLGRTAASFDSQDPASSQARHAKPVGFVALWPEYALLGHSCVPNTSQLVVADRLFMHATDELPKGAPLTRNLIGPSITAPLSVRQAAVAEAVSDLVAATPAAADDAGDEPLLTSCRCARCTLEAGVSEELRETLESAYAWYVNEATETFGRANEEEDVAMLKGLLSEAEALVAEVEEAVAGEAGLDDEQQDWLRASVYDVYDMLVTLDELVNQEGADPDYLQKCLELIRVFAPGSDSHFEVGLKNEALRHHRLDVFSEMLKREKGGARAIGKMDRKKLKALKVATDTAAEFRIEAVILRYGYVTEAILGQLTEGLETYMEGLEQMSVMRSQGMTELTREMEVDGVRVQVVDRLEVSEASRGGAAAGAGSRGGRGTTEVINEDGMQLLVVDGSAEAGVEGMSSGSEEEGAEGEGEEEGELLELDGDVDMSQIQAALDAALDEEIAEMEKEGKM